MNEEWELTPAFISDVVAQRNVAEVAYRKQVEAGNDSEHWEEFWVRWVATAAQRKLVGWLEENNGVSRMHGIASLLINRDKWQALLSALSPQQEAGL